MGNPINDGIISIVNNNCEQSFQYAQYTNGTTPSTQELTMRSNAKMYPAAFYQILLMLKEDGTPLRLPFSSRNEAEEYRFKYYNFLKWCRRPLNASATAHLQGRYNMVEVKLQEHELVFSLRTQERFAAIDDAISRALAAQGLELPAVPREFLAPTRALPKGETLPKDWEPEPVIANPHAIPSYKPEAELAPPSLVNEYVIPEGLPPIQAMLERAIGKDAMARDTANVLRAQDEARIALEEEKRVKRIGWFSQDTKVELSPGDRFNAKQQLGRALDAIVFEERPYFVSYPTATNTYEVNEKEVKRLEMELNDLLINYGMMKFIQVTRDVGSLKIAPTAECYHMLHVCQWPRPRLERTVSMEDLNEARPEIAQLFLQHGL